MWEGGGTGAGGGHSITLRFLPTQLARDLLHPSLEEERRKHKKKRLVQSPNSYFMDVKCPGNRPRVARSAGADELRAARGLSGCGR